MPNIPRNVAEFPAFWCASVNGGRVDDLVALYHDDAVLMPTFSPHAARDVAGLKAYFAQLASREGLGVTLHEETVECLELPGGGAVVNGIYSFAFKVDGTLMSFPSRFTFVLDLGLEAPILHHHSSQIPRTLN